jgi:toxin FitB
LATTRYRRTTHHLPERDAHPASYAGGAASAGERLRRRDSARAAPYEAWLAELARRFADRLVPVTVEVCEEWGRLNVPDPLAVVDGLMAATAKVRGWTLVTRNVADLARADVRLLNPFD